MNNDQARGHQPWDELSAVHALHALDPEDEVRYLAHSLSCARCEQQHDEFALVAAQLGSLAGAEPAEPPSWESMRAGVLVADAPVVPLRSPTTRRRPVTMLLAAAAAALVAFAAGAVTYWQAHSAGTTAPDLTSALAACRQQADCRAVPLHTSRGVMPAAVVVNGDRAAVLPLHMADAPAGRTYVLWQLPRHGSPVAVAEFRDTDRESAATPLPLSRAMTAAFAISVERGDVVPAQPTDVLAVGSAT